MMDTQKSYFRKMGLLIIFIFFVKHRHMGNIQECLPGVNPYPANIFVLKMLSAEYVCCIYSNAFYTILIMEATNMDPDQTAPKGAV